MKKIYGLIGSLILISMLLVSCENPTEDSTTNVNTATNVYPTVTLNAIELKAVAYPGVNVLTWEALKDAGNYSIYRTSGNGKREKLLETTDKPFYLDEKIEAGKTYKYRIIANPADRTVHDASEKIVTINTGNLSYSDYDRQGFWAPKGTTFSNLSQYESEYSYSQELSDYSISTTVLSEEQLKISVKFPVKPYAKYKVEIFSEKQFQTSQESSETIYGVEYNEEAVVYLDAAEPGDKKITVTAIPLNPLYKAETFSVNTSISDISEENLVSIDTVYSEWTNYNSYNKNANARIYFIPVSVNGERISTDHYRIYRSIIRRTGNDELLEIRGNPSSDNFVSIYGETEYYFDDSVYIGNSGDIEKVQYYVVLEYNGKKTVKETSLTVPENPDENWKYSPDNSTTDNSSFAFKDIFIDENQKINVLISNYEWTIDSLSFGKFNTFNQAIVAIESELPYNLEVHYSDSDGSYYSISDSSVDLNNYYAFRVVGSSNSVTMVKTVVILPKKMGEAYYCVIKNGYVENNLKVASAPILNYEKTYNDAYYTSVVLNINSTNARYYNIFRATSTNTTIPSTENFSFIGRSSDSSYTDEDIQWTGLNSYIFYKIEAVGSFSVSNPATIMISGLTAPYVDSNNNVLTWNNVKNATKYYIYRAQSEDDFRNNSEISSYTNTTLTSISVDKCYVCDYFYGIKAACVNGDDVEYSKISNICRIGKSNVPDTTIYSSSSTGLSWYGATDYNGEYWILRCDATGTTKTADEAKDDFLQNPSLYRVSTTSSTSYSMNLGTSSIYKYYYAIVTVVLDPIQNINCYAISNVVEISR